MPQAKSTATESASQNRPRPLPSAWRPIGEQGQGEQGQEDARPGLVARPLPQEDYGQDDTHHRRQRNDRGRRCTPGPAQRFEQDELPSRAQEARGRGAEQDGAPHRVDRGNPTRKRATTAQGTMVRDHTSSAGWRGSPSSRGLDEGAPDSPGEGGDQGEDEPAGWIPTRPLTERKGRPSAVCSDDVDLRGRTAPLRGHSRIGDDLVDAVELRDHGQAPAVELGRSRPPPRPPARPGS